MLKLVDKLFLGNSSVKLYGFKSHCLQILFIVSKLAFLDASLAKLVKALNFGLRDCGFESFKVLKIK